MQVYGIRDSRIGTVIGLCNHAKFQFAGRSTAKTKRSTQALALNQAKGAVASLEAKARSLAKRSGIKTSDFQANIAGMGTGAVHAARASSSLVAKGNWYLNNAIRDSRKGAESKERGGWGKEPQLFQKVMLSVISYLLSVNS